MNTFDWMKKMGSESRPSVFIIMDCFGSNKPAAVCATREAAERWTQEWFSARFVRPDSGRFDIVETTMFE